MNEGGISDRVFKVLASVSEVNVEQINGSMKLRDDLKIGFVIGNGEFLQLRQALETKFKTPIPDEILPREDELAGLTVADVVKRIELFLSELYV